QYRNAERFRARNVLFHRYDRAERIRHVCEGKQLRVCVEQTLEGVELNFAPSIDRDHSEPRAGLLADELPWHDVRVVLQRGDQNLVARLESRSRVALRNEIDRFGRAANEDDFLSVASVEEVAHDIASAFVGIGRPLTQCVYAAMHVRVIALVVGAHGVDHRLRSLARGGVIQINERLPVHLLTQDREVAANARNVDLRLDLDGRSHRAHGFTCTGPKRSVSSASRYSRTAGSSTEVRTDCAN